MESIIKLSLILILTIFGCESDKITGKDSNIDCAGIVDGTLLKIIVAFVMMILQMIAKRIVLKFGEVAIYVVAQIVRRLILIQMLHLMMEVVILP